MKEKGFYTVIKAPENRGSLFPALLEIKVLKISQNTLLFTCINRGGSLSFSSLNSFPREREDGASYSVLKIITRT